MLFDLRQPHHGTIFVRNTEKRRSEPCEVSKNILNAGRLSPKESERLRGRLQFSAGQLFGGRAKASLHTLAKRSRQQAYALSQEVSEACPQLLEILEDGAKGEISSALSDVSCMCSLMPPLSRGAASAALEALPTPAQDWFCTGSAARSIRLSSTNYGVGWRIQGDYYL